MTVVRILAETQLIDRARPMRPQFLETRLFEEVPQLGDEVSVGVGPERRTGKVVRTYRTTMNGDSLFAIEDPWVVLRFMAAS